MNFEKLKEKTETNEIVKFSKMIALYGNQNVNLEHLSDKST